LQYILLYILYYYYIFFSQCTHRCVKSQGARLITPQSAVSVGQPSSLGFATQSKLPSQGYLKWF